MTPAAVDSERAAMDAAHKQRHEADRAALKECFDRIEESDLGLAAKMQALIRSLRRDDRVYGDEW